MKLPTLRWQRATADARISHNAEWADAINEGHVAGMLHALGVPAVHWQAARDACAKGDGRNYSLARLRSFLLRLDPDAAPPDAAPPTEGDPTP